MWLFSSKILNVSSDFKILDSFYFLKSGTGIGILCKKKYRWIDRLCIYTYTHTYT